MFDLDRRLSGLRLPDLCLFVEILPCAALLVQDGLIVGFNQAASVLRGGAVTGELQHVLLGKHANTELPLSAFDSVLVRADGAMLPVRGAQRELMVEASALTLLLLMPAAGSEDAAAGGGMLIGDLIAGAPNAVAMTRQGRLVYTNREFVRMFGRPAAEYLGKDLEQVLRPLDKGQEAAAELVALDENGRASYETVLRAADGTELDVHCDVSRLRLGNGEQGMLHVFRDIRSQKQLEAKLQHQAMHDPLTGLANRALLVDRVQEALKRLRRDPKRSFAVAFLDLDGFKAINDSFGHDVGDQVLLTVSSVLRQTLRPQDTLSRFGGDEFTLVLEDMVSTDAAMQICRRIHRAIAEARLPQDCHVTLSLGLSMVREADRTAHRILREADIAMYTAKASGKAQSLLFEAGMEIPVVDPPLRRTYR